jgi:hypothetical protein
MSTTCDSQASITMLKRVWRIITLEIMTRLQEDTWRAIRWGLMAGGSLLIPT